MEKERLDVFSSLTACIAVADMADGHSSRKQFHPLLVEDLCNKTVTLYPMEETLRVYSYDTAALLSSVLKSMKAVISQAGCILNAIDTEYTTLMVDLVVPIIIVTLTHFVRF